MSLESFMNEFDSRTELNPLCSVERLLKCSVERLWNSDGTPVIALEVRPFNGSIRLCNIRSLKPRHGFGTSALVWFTELAEKHSVSVTGIAIPTGVKVHGLPKCALKLWYERHGFTVSRHGEIWYRPQAVLKSREQNK
jgi:hypothetical protein